MKKTVLWLLCIFPVFCNAQFVATPTGMHAATGVDDVVYGMDGKTPSAIYTEVIQALSFIYASPKEGMTTVENEKVTLNGISKRSSIQVMVFTSAYWANYTMVFKFRNEKLRVDAPQINSIYDKHLNTLGFSSFDPYKNKYIFKKNGKISNPLSKDTLENLFNDLINKISTKTTSDSKYQR